jgi:hypothetical protein
MTLSKAQSEHLGEKAHSTSGNIIAADKVEGTDVYNASGEKLGTVDHIMIDKVGGRVCYAIMSFGGFLGLGESYHPLPWQTLKYDTSQSGFVVAMDKKKLEAAPYYTGTDFNWTPEYGRKVDQYYGVPTYSS